jgi:rRNA processing protein Gar1
VHSRSLGCLCVILLSQEEVDTHRGMQGHQILFTVCNLRVPRDIPTEPRWCACVEMGSFLHSVEDEMLCSSLMPDKVPYFNAPIYLQNKSVIGKVDEILGPINEVHFSVKMGEGMVASSFKKGDKVYIAGDKLLPIERFLPKPKVPGGM